MHCLWESLLNYCCHSCSRANLWKKQNFLCFTMYVCKYYFLEQTQLLCVIMMQILLLQPCTFLMLTITAIFNKKSLLTSNPLTYLVGLGSMNSSIALLVSQRLWYKPKFKQLYMQCVGAIMRLVTCNHLMSCSTDQYMYCWCYHCVIGCGEADLVVDVSTCEVSVL